MQAFRFDFSLASTAFVAEVHGQQSQLLPTLPSQDSITSICPAWDAWVMTTHSCRKK